LNFFLFRESFRKSLPFVASCILLVLQAFTGGRLGVLMTLAAMLYFLPQIVRGWFGRAVAGLGILILAVLADNYSPTKYLTDNASIFRGLTEWQAAPDLLTYLDRISAHRIQIMITALQSIRVEDLLFGKGAGHFDVSVDGRFWMVHNVFLKMLGEFGVMAFVFQLMIVVLPFSSAFRRMSAGSELHLLWLIGIMIGSLQPRYLLTGLSDCLVVWLCYALIFRWANQGNSKEIEIDMAGATRKILPA
jgi:hypothetical protein